eukprot:SAG11_NODE_12585_length_696_cov_0.604690_1_plen_102_part_01
MVAQTRDFLLREGLLVEGEWEALINGDRHTTVFFWLQLDLSRLATLGALTEQRLATISSSITSYGSQANDLCVCRQPPSPSMAEPHVDSFRSKEARQSQFWH